MLAQLEAEVARLEADLAAAKAKVEQFKRDVPVEYHTLTQEAFDKIKGWFA